MRRVLRRLDCMRTPSKSNFIALESDKEDICAPPSTPLLAKRARRSSCGDGSQPPPSPILAKRTHQQASDDGPLTDSSNRNVALGCVAFRGGKRRKSLVTLVVGKERQVFKVEPQMLEHRLLECLLARTKSPASSQDALWEDKENVVAVRSRRGRAPESCPVRLDCDVILFEHILWLLNNDDPAIRQLNIEELMEFYE